MGCEASAIAELALPSGDPVKTQKKQMTVTVTPTPIRMCHLYVDKKALKEENHVSSFLEPSFDEDLSSFSASSVVVVSSAKAVSSRKGTSKK